MSPQPRPWSNKRGCVDTINLMRAAAFAIISLLSNPAAASERDDGERLSVAPVSHFSEYDKDGSRYESDGITATLEMPIRGIVTVNDKDRMGMLTMRCRERQMPEVYVYVEDDRNIPAYSGPALLTAGVGDPKEFVVPATAGAGDGKLYLLFEPDAKAIDEMIIRMHGGELNKLVILNPADGSKRTLSIVSYMLTGQQKEHLAKMSKICR